MSTTFGIEIPSTGEILPIARRVGIGNGKVKIWFTEPLAELVDDDEVVIAMDNSPQGIFTIGCIKEHIIGDSGGEDKNIIAGVDFGDPLGLLDDIGEIWKPFGE
tara:strand:+ start:334 stop:645 length:312 start_codon:yes stop_codon:yes gene_type:complete